MARNTPTSTKGEPIKNGIDGNYFVVNGVKYTKEAIEKIQSAGLEQFHKLILDKLP